MASIRVIHSIDDLADDLRGIAVRAPKDMISTVREAAKVGNVVARDNARRATPHGHSKEYPATFSSEMGAKFFGVGAGYYSAEYGPVERGQGHLAGLLENGSVNNPPQRNLARSADLMGPALAGEVRRLPDRWFW